MAGANRATTSDVAEKLEELKQSPYRFGFFATLRYLESIHADKPRLGKAARPADEPVRLGQHPSLSFANSTLAEFKPGSNRRPAYLSSYFLGLFGPHGPLPTHLTEYAHDREHSYRDPTFRRFADIFHHRMLCFFYRAWADTRPVVSFDRADDRRIDVYIGSLFGAAAPEFWRRDSVADATKRFWAGRLAQSVRPAGALPAILNGYFDKPFTIREFAGEWLPIEKRDSFQLGQSLQLSTLGISTSLGRRVWSCQHRFQLTCGPIDFAAFREFLPGSENLLRLKDLVRNYVGDEFAWDCRLILNSESIPTMRLGETGQLGWTTWLGNRRCRGDSGDVTVSPAASPPGRYHNTAATAQ